MISSTLTKFVGLSTAEFWKAVAADKFAARERVRRGADAGHGVEAFHASLSLMGIDATKSERPRLVAVNGVRLAGR